MPTYEYACARCNASYDLRESFSAETTHRCEHCQKGTAKRVLHAPSVVFKGSGWYVTDSKSKKAAASDSKLTRTESEPASGESRPASGESRPASGESTPVASESKPTPSESKPEPAKASSKAPSRDAAPAG